MPCRGQPDIPLNRPVTTVGSNENARLHLVSRTVSKGHAILVNNGAGTYVADLASRTGVLVNGKLVKEYELNNGDRLQIGKFVFRYRSATNAVAAPAPEAPPASVILVGSPALSANSKVVQIGRRETSDIAIPEDSLVSAAHAVIFQMSGSWYLRDLGSRTGTTINARPIQQQVLNFGDRIGVGSSTILFQPGFRAAVEVEELTPLEVEPELAASHQAVDLEPDDLQTTDLQLEELHRLEAELTAESVETIPAESVFASEPQTIPLESELIPLEGETVLADIRAPLAAVGVEPMPEAEAPEPEALELETFEPDPSELGHPEPASSEQNATAASEGSDSVASSLDAPESIPVELSTDDDAIDELEFAEENLASESFATELIESAVTHSGITHSEITHGQSFAPISDQTEHAEPVGHATINAPQRVEDTEQHTADPEALERPADQQIEDVAQPVEAHAERMAQSAQTMPSLAPMQGEPIAEASILEINTPDEISTPDAISTSDEAIDNRIADTTAPTGAEINEEETLPEIEVPQRSEIQLAEHADSDEIVGSARVHQIDLPNPTDNETAKRTPTETRSIDIAATEFKPTEPAPSNLITGETATERLTATVKDADQAIPHVEEPILSIASSTAAYSTPAPVASPVIVPPSVPAELVAEVDDFVFVPGEEAADASALPDVLFWGDDELDAVAEQALATPTISQAQNAPAPITPTPILPVPIVPVPIVSAPVTPESVTPSVAYFESEIAVNAATADSAPEPVDPTSTPEIPSETTRDLADQNGADAEDSTPAKAVASPDQFDILSPAMGSETIVDEPPALEQIPDVAVEHPDRVVAEESETGGASSLSPFANLESEGVERGSDGLPEVVPPEVVSAEIPPAESDSIKEGAIQISTADEAIADPDVWVSKDGIATIDQASGDDAPDDVEDMHAAADHVEIPVTGADSAPTSPSESLVDGSLIDLPIDVSVHSAAETPAVEISSPKMDADGNAAAEHRLDETVPPVESSDTSNTYNFADEAAPLATPAIEQAVPATPPTHPDAEATAEAPPDYPAEVPSRSISSTTESPVEMSLTLSPQVEAFDPQNISITEAAAAEAVAQWDEAAAVEPDFGSESAAAVAAEQTSATITGGFEFGESEPNAAPLELAEPGKDAADIAQTPVQQGSAPSDAAPEAKEPNYFVHDQSVIAEIESADDRAMDELEDADWITPVEQHSGEAANPDPAAKLSDAEIALEANPERVLPLPDDLLATTDLGSGELTEPPQHLLVPGETAAFAAASVQVAGAFSESLTAVVPGNAVTLVDSSLVSNSQLPTTPVESADPKLIERTATLPSHAEVPDVSTTLSAAHPEIGVAPVSLLNEPADLQTFDDRTDIKSGPESLEDRELVQLDTVVDFDSLEMLEPEPEIEPDFESVDEVDLQSLAETESNESAHAIEPGGDWSGISTVEALSTGEQITSSVGVQTPQAAIESANDLDFLDFSDAERVEPVTPAAQIEAPAAVAAPAEQIAQPPASTIEQVAQPTLPPKGKPSGPPLFGFDFEGGSFLGGMPLSLNTPPPAVAAMPADLQPAAKSPAFNANTAPLSGLDAMAAAPLAGGLLASPAVPFPEQATPGSKPSRRPPKPPAVASPMALSGLVSQPKVPSTDGPVIPPAPKRAPGAGQAGGPAKPQTTNFNLPGTATRTADVFSQMTAPIGVEVFGGRPGNPSQFVIPDSKATQADLDAIARTSAPGQSASPDAESMQDAGLANPDAVPATDDAQAANLRTAGTPAGRTRRRSRLPLVILLMPLSYCAVWWLVYHFVPIGVQVSGTLKFAGLSQHSYSEFHQFVLDQTSLLRGDAVRIKALGILQAEQIAPDFIADHDQYVKVVDEKHITWSHNTSEDYVELAYNTSDMNLGRMRVNAVLNGLKQQDQDLLDARNQARLDADAAKAQVNALVATGSGLQDQHIALAQLAENGPRALEVSQADQDVLNLRQKWEAAHAALVSNTAVLSDLQNQDTSKPIDIAGDSEVIRLTRAIQQQADQIRALKGTGSVNTSSPPGLGTDISVGATTQPDGSDPLAEVLQKQVDALQKKLNDRKADLMAQQAIGPEQREVNKANAIDNLSIKINGPSGLAAVEAAASIALNHAVTNAKKLHEQLSTAEIAKSQADDIATRVMQNKRELTAASNDQAQKELAYASCITVAPGSSDHTNPEITRTTTVTNLPLPCVVFGFAVLTFVFALLIAGELTRPRFLPSTQPPSAAPLVNAPIRAIPWPQPHQLQGLKTAPVQEEMLV